MSANSDILIIGPGAGPSTTPTNHNDLANLDAPGNHKTIQPLVDAVDAFNVNDADGNPILQVDTVADKVVMAKIETLAAKIGSATGILMVTDGAVGPATAGTDYVGPTTGSGIQKADGAGGLEEATAGTDYAAATTGTDILMGDGAGGFAAAAAGTDYVGPTTGTEIQKGDGSGELEAAVPGTDFVDPAGVAGGQTIEGGVAAGEALTLVSTHHANKGSVNIGGDGSTNTVEIEADGTLVRKGTATVWNDIIVQAGNLRPGASAPSFDSFIGGIYAIAFAAGQADEVHGAFEIPHDYKEGTDLIAHIHAAPSNDNTGNLVVGFEFEAQSDAGTFAGTTNTPADPLAMGGTPKKLFRENVATIPGAGRKIGDIIAFRFYRQNGGTDTFTGNLFLL